MANTRQTDFSAGEISSLLHSRTDAPFFAKGLRSASGFIITKQGAAMSRPGTTLVKETKTPAQLLAAGFSLARDDPGTVRLIPFNAADNESFVLEFGLHYIRFHANGGVVESPPGTPYEVVTPYGAADLSLLKYAQVGEVLTLVCERFDAYELRHNGDAPPSWTLSAAITEPLPLDGRSVAFVDLPDPGDGSGLSTSPFTVVDSTGGGAGPSAADTDHPSREWQWMVTALCRRNDTGELFETLGSLVSESYDGSDYDLSANALTSDNFPIYQDLPVTLRREESAGLLPPSSTEFKVESYQFYRGRGGLFGYVGETKTREFVDVGDEPNYAFQPPVGTDPFGDALEAAPAAAIAGLPSDGTAVTRHLDRASAVAYFEARRAFAGLTRQEATVVGSVSGDFDNFDERKLFHIAGEAVVYAIAARRRGRVRHLVSHNRLLVFTEAASYSGGGGGDAPLDHDSVAFPLIEEVGASHVVPAIVDGSIIFARAKGRGLRALVSGGRDAGYSGQDLSELAEHLFRGAEKGIVDLSYAEDPFGVLWVVREDGLLLSLTYVQERMMAWARHPMTHVNEAGDTVTTGTVHGVCAVPEGDEDAVYLVVRRVDNDGVTHQYIERMTSRHERGGCELMVGPDTAASIITPPDYICVDSAIAYVGPAATTFTGLGHLEGKEVWIVAQGHPTMGPYTVSGGSITAEGELAVNVTGDNAPAGDKLVAYIGLLYQPELELLDVAGAEARTRNKQVTHVGFEVDNAKGVLAGQDFASLDDQPSREVQDGFGTAPLQTNFFLVAVRGTWDYSARAVLRQSEPLPVTVIGVSRVLAGGDSGGF